MTAIVSIFHRVFQMPEGSTLNRKKNYRTKCFDFKLNNKFYTHSISMYRNYFPINLIASSAFVNKLRDYDAFIANNHYYLSFNETKKTTKQKTED